MLGNIENGHLTTVFTDSDETWVEMRHDDPTWLDNGRWFSWLSERDGWRHLYLVGRDGKDLKLVTAGDYDVTALDPPRRGRRVGLLPGVARGPDYPLPFPHRLSPARRKPND